MLQDFPPLEGCRLPVATILLNPTYSDLAFSFCAEVEALMRFLGELEDPEIGGNTNDACCLRFVNS